MSRTSKSPRKVALEAMAVAEESLAAYASRFSRKDFTQYQLFVCLVLKAFFKTDYRGIVEILRDSPDLMRAIGLKTVPHITTLQKVSDRLLKQATAAQLLDGTIRRTLGDRPHGRWRRLMRRYRDFRYGQRWQVETAVSMIKRRLGHALRARSEDRRNAEMRLMVLTHNIMIRYCPARVSTEQT